MQRGARWLIGVSVILTVFDVGQPRGYALAGAGAAPANNRIPKSYGKLPLRFEAVQDNAQPDVFVSRGPNYMLIVAPTAVQFGVDAPVRITLAGGNPRAPLDAVDELPGKTNYLRGSDRSAWRIGVPGYARVHARGVYPGIDVQYYGNGQEMETDFVIAPGADPTHIALDIAGASQVRIDRAGELVMATAAGDLRLRRPVIYQRVSGTRQEVAGGYRLMADRTVGFDVGPYDDREPLIIDPVLSYATYLGGTAGDFAQNAKGIAVDSAGNAYVTGSAHSADFPVSASGVLQSTYGGDGSVIQGDAFVAKLNPDGTALVYCTYIGGSDGDFGVAIAVDASGNAYVTGATSSTNFPGAASSTIQSSYGGGLQDGFVAKLNASGSALLFSTYLGGTLGDNGHGIALDSAQNVYVTGWTASTGFPGTASSPIQASRNGSNDDFVAKINAAGTALVYATYLGGSNQELPGGIAVDASGSAYVSGTTFPNSPGGTDPHFTGTASSPVQSAYGGGGQDGFIAKVNASGSALLYASYLGGDGYDTAYDVAIDGSGNAYVVGSTSSTNFIGVTSGSLQSSLIGGFDAFIVKMNAAGTALTYSTYFSGSAGAGAFGVAVDGSGNAFVMGTTSSTDLPGVGVNAVQPANAGGFDAFVAELNSTATGVVYATYLGGTDTDLGSAIAIDSAGSIYVTGNTFSNDFVGASASSIQPTYGGAGDVFVAKLGVPTSTTINGGLAVGPGQTFTFNGGGVTGNITMTGGTLVLMNAAVGGNLQVTGGSLTVINSTIQGNVQISGNATFFIDPSFLNGNLEIHDIAQGMPADALCAVTIKGNLSVHNNAASVSIGAASGCEGNKIGKNMDVTKNTAAVQVYGNAVGKNLSCSQNGSIAGAGNTAAKKAGQCAAF